MAFDRPVERTPVSFPGKTGLKLFGILHQRAGLRAPQEAIVLLSPGIKARVAPHRLYVDMADRFAELGFPVLRFDFHGLGDSEGELPERVMADVYGSIQLGRYVDDTIAALDWLERQTGASRFIVSGLCGGAITGLLAAAGEPRIVCLIGVAIPVILDGAHIESDRYLSVAQLRGKRDRYLRRLLDIRAWRSWLRLATGRSDYRLIVRSLMQPLIERFRRGDRSPPCAPGGSPADNTNRHFAPAFFRVLDTGRRIFLVFAEADRLSQEYEAKFVARFRSRLAAYGPAVYDVHVTKNANHIFSFPDWQEDLLARCCAWLRPGGVGGQGD